jgi:hypothetical protein
MRKRYIAGIASVSLILLTVHFIQAQNNQTVGGQVTVVSASPSNCTLGTLFFNTTTNLLSVCKVTDTLVTVMVPPLRGTTGTITGTILVIGGCDTGTASIAGATTSMHASASPVTDPGTGVVWHAWVSSANTVTVKECALLSLTPANTTYNVVVNP